MKQSVLKDEYRRKARLQPALILIFPVALTLGIVVIRLGVGSMMLVRGVSGIVAAIATNIGLVMVLEGVVRERGKLKEPGLWASWGGAPTTRVLRHRETELSTPVQRRRIHEKLKALVPKVQIPTQGKEMKDPVAADQAYEECVRYLRNATRDESKYPLILKENIHYGFARNLWAMRAAGIAVSAAGALATGWMTWAAWRKADSLVLVDGVVLAVEVLLLAWWIFKVTPSWVFVPARAYAERLFEACDSMKPMKPPAAKLQPKSRSK